MEATVEKLEAMFLKSEADLDYISKRLKLEFITDAAENQQPAPENLAVMLESLKEIKAKHSSLSSQVKEINTAQKESMDAIRQQLRGAVELLQHLQHAAELEVEPLTSTEQALMSPLGSDVTPPTAQDVHLKE